MTYTSSIPLSGESLGSTRDRIRTNFQEIATVFEVNHVAFNALGEGKHNVVQTPDQSGHLTTALNEPKFYATSASNAGVLQFSRAGSDAVPTPVSAVQSPAAFVPIANGAFANVLDFTGLTRATGMLYAFNELSANNGRTCAFIWWDGITVRANVLSTGASFLVPDTSTSPVLRLQNSSGSNMQVFWTLDLKRVS